MAEPAGSGVHAKRERGQIAVAFVFGKMASRMINFDLVTPVSGPNVRAGANEVAAVCKSILLSSEGKHFPGGEDFTARVHMVSQAQKAFEVLEIALAIHWGGQACEKYEAP